MADFLLHFTPVLAQLGQDELRTNMIFASLLVIFLAIGIHEFCHAKFADMAGDPTPRIFGRVTLNLFNHFDPMGALFIIITVVSGFGIGWGRPVPMDPSKMRNPRWDHFASVAAGPVSNLLQAVIWAVLAKVMMPMAGSLGPFMVLLPFMGVAINIGLFLFNLIPIGPLDGMWILGTFLPQDARDKWTYWNLRTGQFVFLGLIVLGMFAPEISPIRFLIMQPARFLTNLLLGPVL